MGETATTTSKAIKKAAELAADVKASPGHAQTPSKLMRRRVADAFELTRPNGKTLLGPPSLAVTEGCPQFLLPLVSIGAHSDAILDKFKLEDGILPRLHTLITHLRSSRWEKELRSPEWNIPPEQAALLAQALLLDVHGKQDLMSLTVGKVKSEPMIRYAPH
jgi:hypothetical protein